MTVQQKLQDLGCTIWEVKNYKRIYINKPLLEKVFGLRFEQYKTGNIKHAELNGEKISNTKAYNLLSQKFYFDCVTQEWVAPIDPVDEFKC